MNNSVARTDAWLRQFILQENICPFAHLPYKQGRVRIMSSTATREEEGTQHLLAELLYLYEHPREESETSLLVFPTLFEDFDDFWAYVEWTEELLTQADLHGVFQIVGFHPDFRFADSKGEKDAADFTNRSPFPLLHIIREESITEAQMSYPDVDGIPALNAKKLRSIGYQVLIDALNTFTR